MTNTDELAIQIREDVKHNNEHSCFHVLIRNEDVLALLDERDRLIEFARGVADSGIEVNTCWGGMAKLARQALIGKDTA